MLGPFRLVFLMAAICGPILLLSALVDAQSTVDQSASCESSALDEAVNVIKEELKDVRLIRDDLRDVKSACGSNQQQTGAVTTSSLCECKTRIFYWQQCAQLKALAVSYTHLTLPTIYSV